MKNLIFTLLLLLTASCSPAFAQTTLQRTCPGASPSPPTATFDISSNGTNTVRPCATRSTVFTGNVDFTGATVIGITTVSGSGTTNFIPRFTGASSIGNTPFSWDATKYLLNNTAVNSQVTMELTPALTGSFKVGDYTTSPTTYFTQDYNTGTTNVTSSNLIRLHNQDNTTFFTVDTNGASLAAKALSGISFDSGAAFTRFGDLSGVGNGTVIDLDDTTSTIIGTAKERIRMDSKSGIFEAGDVTNESDGTKIIVDETTNNITLQSGAAPVKSVLYLDASNVLTGATLVDGGLLIGSSGGAPAAGTITAGAGISVTNGSNSITIASTSGGGALLSCLVNNTVLANTTGTVFCSPGNLGTPLTVTTEGAVSYPVTRAGTIRNLFVRTGTIAKVNTPVTTITVRKNGADSAVTLTMTETTATTTSDTTHSFSAAQGDLITVSLSVAGVAAVSTSIAGISFQID